MPRPESDALTLEYKRDYGLARGNVDVADLINNPAANGVRCIFRLSLSEQPLDLGIVQVRPLKNNVSNPLLVRQDRGTLKNEGASVWAGVQPPAPPVWVTPIS